MGYKVNIFNSESEFLEYVISNFQNISLIIIFEDILDHVIFFYFFDKDGSIGATKELAYKNFSSFETSYKNLAKKLLFSVYNYPDQKFAIKLVSEGNKKQCI